MAEFLNIIKSIKTNLYIPLIRNFSPNRKDLRIKKIEEFHNFLLIANKTFSSFYDDSKDNLSFSDYYRITDFIKNENKYISIYFERFKHVEVGEGMYKRIENENSVKLTYINDKFGNTICLLEPANTGEKNLKIIKFNVNTLKLTNKKTLKRHWNIMYRYMNMTSIEGNPSIYDKIIVYLLFFTCQTYYDNVIHQPKYIVCLIEILKFALTVGLSGFLLLFTQKFF